MKRIVKVTALILILALMANISAFAADTRASTRISYTTATATKSSGNVSIYMYIKALDTMSVIGANSVKVQRSTGSSWVTEYTYNLTNTPSLQTTNANYFSKTLSYAPDYSSSSYRAIVEFYVKDSTGSETKTRTTSGT